VHNKYTIIQQAHDLFTSKYHMFSEIYDVAVKTAMGIDLDEKAAAVSVFLIT